MTTTFETPLSPEIQSAKDSILRYTGRIRTLLEFVPEDKLAWSPSESARSALRLAGHAAHTNSVFAALIGGTMPSPMPTVPEFFGSLHAGEHGFTSKAQVLSRMDETTAELIAAVEAVSPSALDEMRDSPFGPLPVRFWLAESVAHLVAHMGQLAYLQTIWGDMDDHVG